VNDLRKKFAPTQEEKQSFNTLSLTIDVLSVAFGGITSVVWNNVSIASLRCTAYTNNRRRLQSHTYEKSFEIKKRKSQKRLKTKRKKSETSTRVNNLLQRRERKWKLRLRRPVMQQN
jgi:hypothetical protein